ncbi:NADP-dependent oxidoreductase [Ancylobacter sonchi]|uniref:NADP-dependent oxidoreductase n=1 Tax=Ancylobacter sonchi TaxID=1937790 RepID=UPI001BD5C67A|nr:NADP-dependent oxidoreductase [Ancylobacter sonchi]MBS7536847.1 NADP-dependent oxidoreductase [Ancylobacter sonchi]
MKAVQFAEYGGPEVLRVVDLEPPRPGPGEVRIAVRATGVNPSDWKRRAGLYRDVDPVAFPSGVGVEASGIVDEIGPGVSNVAVGDAVFGMGRGTVAEQAVLTNWVRKPDAMSFEVAGGLSVIVETALRSLGDLGVERGQTLLVSGASGGIGSAVVQIARSRGIVVVGTAGERNQDYLRDLGATPTTYGPGLKERVHALAPHGIDAALDVAGSGILPELIEIVGAASGVVSVADFSASRYGARFSAGPPRDPDRVLAEAVRLWVDGHLHLNIDRLFPFVRTAEAHEVSARGHVAGKLVITVP